MVRRPMRLSPVATGNGHRQALDFTELRATYSRQLAGRLVNARESIEQVGRVSNLYYRSLLSAPIKRILEGCSSNSEVQE